MAARFSCETINFDILLLSVGVETDGDFGFGLSARLSFGRCLVTRAPRLEVPQHTSTNIPPFYQGSVWEGLSWGSRFCWVSDSLREETNSRAQKDSRDKQRKNAIWLHDRNFAGKEWSQNAHWVDTPVDRCLLLHSLDTCLRPIELIGTARREQVDHIL